MVLIWGDSSIGERLVCTQEMQGSNPSRSILSAPYGPRGRHSLRHDAADDDPRRLNGRFPQALCMALRAPWWPWCNVNMGGREPSVAGANPVGHPFLPTCVTPPGCSSFGRAPCSGDGGRWFESSQPDSYVGSSTGRVPAYQAGRAGSSPARRFGRGSSFEPRPPGRMPGTPQGPQAPRTSIAQAWMPSD